MPSSVASASAALRLSLDPLLTLWVLLPITLATLLMAVLRRNLVSLLSIEPRVTQAKALDANNLWRSSKLRQNAAYISKNQMEIRRYHFVRSGGPFDKPVSNASSPTSVTALLSPDSLSNQAVGLVFTVLPQMFLGSWASATFQGLIICRLPFTLTHRFKTMLQSGFDLSARDLDAAYVSSLSWYILNLFGNSALLSLIAPPATNNSVDSGALVPSLSSQLSMSLKPQKAFNAEKELLLGLNLPSHNDVRDKARQQFLAMNPLDFVSVS